MRQVGLLAAGLVFSGLMALPGQSADFKKYNGRVMLVVNLASQ